MKCPKCGAEMREKNRSIRAVPGMLKLATMQWNQGREANRQFDSKEANEADKTESRDASHTSRRQ